MRVEIGTDRSEQLDYRSASLFAVEHFVHKYVCPCCSKQRAQVPGQQVHPSQEPEAMLAPHPGPQPALPSAPVTPKPIAPDQQATDQDQRPPAPLPACRPPEPDAVVIAAPKPAMPIAKGLPGPGLLARSIVSKYTDHSRSTNGSSSPRAYERKRR